MSAKIRVNQKQTDQELIYQFEVEVEENTDKSTHLVTMSSEFYQNLNTQQSPAEVIKESFKFLLEREPKESILSEFDVKIISNYFPEYQAKLKEKL